MKDGWYFDGVEYCVLVDKKMCWANWEEDLPIDDDMFCADDYTPAFAERWLYPDKDHLPEDGMFIAQYRLSSGTTTQDFQNALGVKILTESGKLIRWLPAPTIEEDE